MWNRSGVEWGLQAEAGRGGGDEAPGDSQLMSAKGVGRGASTVGERGGRGAD